MWDSVKQWYDLNSWWIGIVGLLTTIVSLVLAFVWRPRASKYLVWAARSRLIARRESELEMFFRGDPVGTCRMSTVRFANTSRQEVRPDDSQGETLVISFPNSRVLTYEVSGASVGLAPTFKVRTEERRQVEVNPLLMNPQDWFELQILLDGPDETPAVRAPRLAGQTRPTRQGNPYKFVNRKVRVSAIVVGCLGLLALFLFPGLVWVSVPSVLIVMASGVAWTVAGDVGRDEGLGLA